MRFAFHDRVQKTEITFSAVVVQGLHEGPPCCTTLLNLGAMLCTSVMKDPLNILRSLALDLCTRFGGASRFNEKTPSRTEAGPHA